jgi:hypothetical protein
MVTPIDHFLLILWPGLGVGIAEWPQSNRMRGLEPAGNALISEIMVLFQRFDVSGSTGARFPLRQAGQKFFATNLWPRRGDGRCGARDAGEKVSRRSIRAGNPLTRLAVVSALRAAG